MKKFSILLAFLLVTGCNDSDNSNDTSNNLTNPKEKQYSYTTLGPSVSDNTLRIGVMTDEVVQSKAVTSVPEIKFDQTDGEVIITNAQGVRSAEAVFLSINNQQMSAQSCDYVALVEQPDTGCLFKVTANDLSEVHLKQIHLYDHDGNPVALRLN